MFGSVMGDFPVVLDELQKASCKIKHFSSFAVANAELMSLVLVYLNCLSRRYSVQRENINSSTPCSFKKEAADSNSGRNVWAYL